MLRLRLALVVALVGLALGPALAAPEEDKNNTAQALVATASKYVAKYQQDVSFLLSDETYRQTRTAASGQCEDRVMRSELFLTYLPADNEWVAVRDVVEVDGAPAEGREDLRTLLARGDKLRGLISQIVARNARYNIGFARNFNEPTLPLLLLDAKRVGDVHFERRKLTQDGDALLATLAFAERGRPTLVRGPRGSMQAKGEIVIEAGTGAVRRTTFELAQDGFKVKLTTDYARDLRLGLWLPAVFGERYENAPAREVIIGQATYANYRRFDVTSRIR